MITTKIHGVADYIAGVILILAPWILGFALMGAETWIPVFLGLGMIIYALFTDFELGVVKVIPMATHLKIDLVAGIFLLLSPWLFGFSGIVWGPHFLVGALMIAGALMTERVPMTARSSLSETSPRSSPRETPPSESPSESRAVPDPNTPPHRSGRTSANQGAQASTNERGRTTGREQR